MAEHSFQEVMKHWRRMCKAQDDGSNRDVCATCPLKPGCSAIYEDDDMDYVHVEQVITKWAAEHPEPVYPTWEEWLLDNGVFEPDNVRLHGDYRFYMNGKALRNIPTEKLFQSIPADIAQKLGLEPLPKA